MIRKRKAMRATSKIIMLRCYGWWWEDSVENVIRVLDAIWTAYLYRVGQKVTRLFCTWVSSLVGCIIFAIFCLLAYLFHQMAWSLGSCSSVVARINCNFFAMVGLACDERCFIHDLRVEKHCGGPEEIMEMFSNKWARLNRDWLAAGVKIVQTV